VRREGGFAAFSRDVDADGVDTLRVPNTAQMTVLAFDKGGTVLWSRPVGH
jgi:hypothetical protein